MHLRPVGDHGHSVGIQGPSPRDGPRRTGESLSAPRKASPGQPLQLCLQRPRPSLEGQRTPVQGGASSGSTRPSVWYGGSSRSSSHCCLATEARAATFWRFKGARQLLHRLDLSFSFWSSGCLRTPEVTGQLQRRALTEDQLGQLGGSLCLGARSGRSPWGRLRSCWRPQPQTLGHRPVTLTVTLARETERSHPR